MLHVDLLFGVSLLINEYIYKLSVSKAFRCKTRQLENLQILGQWRRHLAATVKILLNEPEHTLCVMEKIKAIKSTPIRILPQK